MYELFEELLVQIINVSILFLEFVGVFIIIISAIRGVLDYVKKNPQIRLNLANGMALGLEFKLGSEILRTVTVRDLSEIAIVASIIILRAALTFLIHWEIKVEKADEEETLQQHSLYFNGPFPCGHFYL